MLDAAFYGAVFKDAETRESKSGNRYSTAIIAVRNGQDEDGRDQSQFIKVIAFQEFADELGKLKRGDRAYCEGVLDVKIWSSDKGPRPDLSLKARFVRRTAIGKDRPKRDQAPDADRSQIEHQLHAATRRGDFDDRIPF